MYEIHGVAGNCSLCKGFIRSDKRRVTIFYDMSPIVKYRNAKLVLLGMHLDNRCLWESLRRYASATILCAWEK